MTTTEVGKKENFCADSMQMADLNTSLAPRAWDGLFPPAVSVLKR